MNKEIEELRRVLERKKEERASIEREKAGEEEKIEVVRREFGEELETLRARGARAEREERRNREEAAEWERDVQTLNEYEESFRARVADFKKELAEIAGYRDGLDRMCVEISQRETRKGELLARVERARRSEDEFGS